MRSRAPSVARCRALDANVPLFGIRTLEDQLDAFFAHNSPGGRPHRWIRHSRAAAERDRRLRRHRAGGQPPDTRHRHPHGAWCSSPATSSACIGRRGLTLVVTGLSLGLAGLIRFHSDRRSLAVRGDSERQRDVRRDVGIAGRRVPDCDLYPRASGDPARCGRRDSVRMIHRNRGITAALDLGSRIA